MNNLALNEERLKNLIVLDRSENPNKILKLLKSEVLNVLRNYFDINFDDLGISIIINKKGEYDLQINAISKKFLIADILE